MRILYLPSKYAQQRQFTKPGNIYPVRLAMEATFHHDQGDIVHWGKPQGIYDRVITEPEGLPFLKLPHPDRILTDVFNPEYQKNGNFKYHPGTYIQTADGCWWGNCTFCVEQGKTQEVRDYRDVIQEIEELQAMGFREIFDDSGTFPYDLWKLHFWDSLEWLNKKWGSQGIRFSFNYRMVDEDYARLRRAGARMILFGLESANQKTLDKIQKGTGVEDVKYIIKAAKAGLESHIAVMFGFPWETEQDALRTLRLVHYLLKRGYARTAQASFYRPKEDNGNITQKRYVKRIYEVAYSPEFWFNKLRDVKDIDDLKYLWKQIKVGLYERFVERR
jgi:radical SAM superfamily enzyme YgiQ (UPF0313 family)